MRTTPSRRRARRVILAVASTCIVAPVRAQRADSVPAPLVVEVRIGDVASTVLEARVRNGTVLLPGRSVLALAGLDSAEVAGSRSLADVAVLLHAAITFDTTALLVQVADSGTLPVSRRAARARARARLAAADAGAASPVRPASDQRLPSAVDLSYAAQRGGAVSVDASLRLSGGVAELTTSRVPGRGMRSEVSWTSLPLLTLDGARVRIGSIDELDGGSGMLLTNAPIERTDTLRFGSLGLRLPPGTELELFDDGVLVGADSVRTDERLRLGHAERRGVHEMRLVTYDSAGRARVTRWTEYLPEAFLRAGELRYAIAARACLRLACALPVAQLSYAPVDRLTIAAHVARSDEPTGVPGWTSHASLDARVAASTALSVHVESHGTLAGELRVQRRREESLVVRVERADAAHGAPLASAVPIPMTSVAATPLVTASGSWRIGSAATLDMVAGHAGSGVIAGARASAFGTIGVLRGSAALVDAAVRCASVSAAALLWGAWLPPVLAALHSAALSVRADHRSVGCGDESSGALGLLLPALRGSALELSAGWERPRAGRARVALSLALRRRIAGAVDVHAELVDDRSAQVVRSDVSGALTIDALRRSISFAPGAAGGTSGVHGVVYADDNANDRRDPGERVVAGALIRVGEASGVSDERGLFVVPELPTDRLVRVAVDSLSVEDQGYVPGVPIAVTLVSRALVRVDVPLRRTRAEPIP